MSADLNDGAQIEAAVSGCDFVIHTASPVQLNNPRDHNDLIRPAVNGVTFVVKACQKNKVKRVVITSSVAAVSYMLPQDEPDEFDETCWSSIEREGATAYMKSKTLAERAAWDLRKEWLDKGEFAPEIVTVCPSLVLGEVIGQGTETSASMVTKMMNNQISAYP